MLNNAAKGRLGFVILDPVRQFVGVGLVDDASNYLGVGIRRKMGVGLVFDVRNWTGLGLNTSN